MVKVKKRKERKAVSPIGSYNVNNNLFLHAISPCLFFTSISSEVGNVTNAYPIE
jgi:hypothetical protein